MPKKLQVKVHFKVSREGHEKHLAGPVTAVNIPLIFQIKSSNLYAHHLPCRLTTVNLHTHFIWQVIICHFPPLFHRTSEHAIQWARLVIRVRRLEVTNNTGCLQKNGAVSKINKKFISHLTRAKRTPSAATTVQVSHALPAVRFSCLMRGRGASFQDGVAAGKGFLCAPFWGVQICDCSAAWVSCTV